MQLDELSKSSAWSSGFPVENGVPDIHHTLVVPSTYVGEAMDLSDVDLSQSITLEVTWTWGWGGGPSPWKSTDGLQRGLPY